jgi:hypothetical protein
MCRRRRSQTHPPRARLFYHRPEYSLADTWLTRTLASAAAGAAAKTLAIDELQKLPTEPDATSLDAETDSLSEAADAGATTAAVAPRIQVEPMKKRLSAASDW